jgi:AhpD family alkylhydroperoxidase
LAFTRLAGAELDDVGKLALQRPRTFGPFLELAHDVLRGTSAWSVGERELLAAVVSSTNACAFCIGTHGRIADALLGEHIGWEDGRFGERLTAAAVFAQSLALGVATPQHATSAREVGCTQKDLEDVIDIVFTFCTVNRVADALGLSYRSERDRLRGAAVLRRTGYRLPGFLLKAQQSR